MLLIDSNKSMIADLYSYQSFTLLLRVINVDVLELNLQSNNWQDHSMFTNCLNYRQTYSSHVAKNNKLLATKTSLRL